MEEVLWVPGTGRRLRLSYHPATFPCNQSCRVSVKTVIMSFDGMIMIENSIQDEIVLPPI